MTYTLPLLLSLTVAPADAPTPLPDAAVSDAAELRGEWEIVGCNDGGIDRSVRFKGWRMLFVGESVYLRDAGEGAELLGMVRADPSADPPRIDVTAPEGVLHRTAYRRGGDAVFWAWGRVGGPLPSSFEPAENVTVWTLRRLKR
jgi:hypothetical protein